MFIINNKKLEKILLLKLFKLMQMQIKILKLAQENNIIKCLCE